ncbi:hypothetical protein tpqmel_0486 [Candidatus Gastranaerophilus sp. (ex Termes propinquus)]|nr:hypothetical protein tpqmel_0486 [Candidatus Gastranaerophilus sp. (ex Termes propinquus)]
MSPYPQTNYYNNYAAQAPYPQNYNNLSQGMSKLVESTEYAPSGAPQATEESKDTKKTDEKKTKVLLTDDYIMSLENYLNNENTKIRLSAAKELLERFKEDDTRKTDVALTALLNKVIQDPSPTVRFMGLTVLDIGYATGNQDTVNLLKQIQQSSDQYGEDALLASQALLKMSGQKVEIPKE